MNEGATQYGQNEKGGFLPHSGLVRKNSSSAPSMKVNSRQAKNQSTNIKNVLGKD